jgi:hypothetical protein
MIRGAVVLALAMSYGAAASAEQPLLRPSRDVDVTYRAIAQGGAAVEQRVRWLAATQTMRIDPPSPGMRVIIDYVARRMSVVRDQTRSVVDMAAPDSMADVIGGKLTLTYARRGQVTVAGRTCTEWQTEDRAAHKALVCITDDGVLLRAGTPDQVRISATAVNYAPQDPATFRIPADYARRSAGAAR